MSVRLPQSFRQSFSPEGGVNALEYEMMSERASSLGRNGLKVESALAALKAWNPDRHSDEQRETLVNEASDAVWALFVQREICGLRNNKDIVQRYAIPGEVLARVGIIRK